VLPSDGFHDLPSGAPGGTVTFTVQNTTGAQTVYALSCLPEGAVPSCSLPGGLSITLAAGESADVPVDFTYDWNATTTGTVTLEAVSPGDYGSGRYTIRVPAPPPVIRVGVTVTPDEGAVSPSANTENTVVFQVTNTGDLESTYLLSPTCTGTAVGCPAPTAVTIAKGATRPWPIPYQAGASGTS
jgi:hypothetical protein